MYPKQQWGGAGAGTESSSPSQRKVNLKFLLYISERIQMSLCSTVALGEGTDSAYGVSE